MLGALLPDTTLILANLWSQQQASRHVSLISLIIINCFIHNFVLQILNPDGARKLSQSEQLLRERMRANGSGITYYKYIESSDSLLVNTGPGCCLVPCQVSSVCVLVQCMVYLKSRDFQLGIIFEQEKFHYFIHVQPNLRTKDTFGPI